MIETVAVTLVTPFMLASSPTDITPSAQPQMEYNWSTQNAASIEELEEIGKAAWTAFQTNFGNDVQGD